MIMYALIEPITMRYLLLPFVILFFLLCARLIWKMNGNTHLYARTKYARTSECKLCLNYPQLLI